MYGEYWDIGFHSDAEMDWTDVAASAVVVSCGWDRKSGRTAGLLVRLFRHFAHANSKQRRYGLEILKLYWIHKHRRRQHAKKNMNKRAQLEGKDLGGNKTQMFLPLGAIHKYCQLNV